MTAAARTLYHWALGLDSPAAVTLWGTLGEEAHTAVTLLGEVVELREDQMGARLLRRDTPEPHWPDARPPWVLAHRCTTPRQVVAGVRRLGY